MNRSNEIWQANRESGYIYMIKPHAFYKNGVKRIPFKIGYSWYSDVTSRLKSIQAGNFMPLEIYATYGRMVDVRFHERNLHNFILSKFPDAETHRSAGKEWFWLSKKELKIVEDLMLDVSSFWALGTSEADEIGRRPKK
jgi:hypothetical protein